MLVYVNNIHKSDKKNSKLFMKPRKPFPCLQDYDIGHHANPDHTPKASEVAT